MCRCIPLQLDPELQPFSQYGLSMNNIIYYNYTSEENFTKFLDSAKLAAKYFSEFYSSVCLTYAVIFVYNLVFIPCNLTAGTPRPLCSSACYFFSSFCDSEYEIIVRYASLFGIPYSDDCENTLNHLNKLLKFPNISKDFENDCVDFPGI